MAENNTFLITYELTSAKLRIIFKIQYPLCEKISNFALNIANNIGDTQVIEPFFRFRTRKSYTIMLLDKIDDLLKEVSQLSAKNAEDVEQLRIKYLSKKGEISELMDEFRSVAKDKKKEFRHQDQ